MKRYLLSVLCLLSFSVITAQTDSVPEKAWKFDGILGLNATGTGLINWSGGGKNTVSGLTFAKLHLLYRHKNGIAWETNFDTDFGLAWIDEEEDRLRKTSDKIKLATKLGWEFKPNWYLTFLASFQSQYATGRAMKKGYDPPISMLLAPSYTDVSVGIDWKTNVKGCYFSLYFSPFSGRVATAYVSDKWNRIYTEEYQKFCAEDPEYEFRTDMRLRYGTYKIIKDEQGNPDIKWRNYRAEFGPSLKGAIDYKLRNLTLNSTIELFTPYQGKGYNIKEAYEETHPGETWDIYFEYSNLNRQFGRFDVDWDVNLTYTFAKVLDVTLSTSMRYYSGLIIADSDGNYRERLQFKSVLGIGIGYSF